MNQLLQSISPTRLIIYTIILGILPVIFAVYHHHSERTQVGNLEMYLESVKAQAEAKDRSQATNLAVKSHYKNADRFYIDKHVESIPLLTKEVEALKKIINQQHLIENEAAKRRLDQLQTANKLRFSEGVVQSYPYFYETQETLVAPIEVDTQNISEILSRIEGVKIGNNTPVPGRPQLIITDFKFDKKDTGNKNEVYQLNLKIIKREFF